MNIFISDIYAATVYCNCDTFNRYGIAYSSDVDPLEVDKIFKQLLKDEKELKKVKKGTNKTLFLS